MNSILFQPDNHHSDLIFSSAGSASQLEVLRKVIENSRYFRSKSVGLRDVKALGGGGINSSNFRVEGVLIKLKVSSEGKKNPFYGFESISGILQSRGMPAPEIIESGSVYVEASSTRFYYSIQEFIEGNYFSGCLNELDSMFEYFKSSKDIADDLCALPLEFPELYKPAVLPWMEASLSAIPIRIHELGVSDDGLSMFISKYNLIMERFSEIKRGSDFYKEAGIYHCDLHPHNLLFSKGKLVSIVDFESYRHMPAATSIGFGLFKLTRKTLVKRVSNLSEIQHVIKQAAFDAERFGLMASLEILRRILLIVNARVFENSFAWYSDLPKQLSSLDEVERVFSF